MARIGLLGGTFDPVHNGHIAVLKEAKRQLLLDRIILVPAGDPPHKTKKKVTDKEHRLRMAQLVFEKADGVLVSDYEIRKNAPAYSVDLVRYFAEQYPQDELFFIVGADSFRDLPSWWRYRELMSMVSFVVVSRPDTKKSELLSRFDGDEPPPRVFYLNDIAVDISSTQIRALVYHGEEIGHLVPPEIQEYIKTNQLYRE